jgi:hypothetical protein
MLVVEGSKEDKFKVITAMTPPPPAFSAQSAYWQDCAYVYLVSGVVHKVYDPTLIKFGVTGLQQKLSL